MIRDIRLSLLVSSALVAFASESLLAATISPAPEPVQLRAQHVGEFEPQQALLMGWDNGTPEVQDTLVQVIAHVSRKLPVILLVDSPLTEESARIKMDQAGIVLRTVQFARVPFNSIWARDYGPSSVKTRAGVVSLVDADYIREALRTDDDAVPYHLAKLLNLPVDTVPLQLEGGNVLSNGRGLLLTTTVVLESNPDEPADLVAKFKQSYGADRVVFLEPLEDEGTGHVDMFATFTDSTTVVLGRYDPAVDPVNSAILDRNAQLLSGLITPEGPLKVVRIPMPQRQGNVLTYTNVIYVNGTLLLPDYPGSDEQARQQAIAVYQKLLPRWNIVPIDCNPLIKLGGALHCVAMNLARSGRLPIHEFPPGPAKLDPLPGLEPQYVLGRSAFEFAPGAIAHPAILRGSPPVPIRPSDVVFAMPATPIGAPNGFAQKRGTGTNMLRFEKRHAQHAEASPRFLGKAAPKHNVPPLFDVTQPQRPVPHPERWLSAPMRSQVWAPQQRVPARSQSLHSSAR